MELRNKENNESKEIRTGRINEACARYSVGANTMRKYADEAGAVIRLGKCYLIDFNIMDAFMSSKAGKGAEI